MAKISLIIALYNAKKYLRVCLDSVQAQTFEDFECLCINDGSKDDTVKIVEEYAQKDKRFKLINQENAGCSMARNKGLESASAPYVALLDQDDLLHPQAFETLYYLIEKYKTDVAAFKFQPVNDDFILENPTMYKIDELEAKVSDTPFDDFFKNKKGSQVEVWTRLYNKQAIKDSCFPKDVQPAEDTIFTLKVMYNIKNIVTTPTNLLFYRDSVTSVMNQGKTEKYIRSHILAANVLYDYFIKSNKLKGKRLEQMRYYISRIIFKTCISQVLRRVKDKSQRQSLLKLSHSLVEPLFQKGIFQPKILGIKQSISCKLFLKCNYIFARMFV